VKSCAKVSRPFSAPATVRAVNLACTGEDDEISIVYASASLGRSFGNQPPYTGSAEALCSRAAERRPLASFKSYVLLVSVLSSLTTTIAMLLRIVVSEEYCAGRHKSPHIREADASSGCGASGNGLAMSISKSRARAQDTLPWPRQFTDRGCGHKASSSSTSVDGGDADDSDTTRMRSEQRIARG
jgi:hypothetical protein